MPVTPPIAPEDASEGVTRIFDRIKETIGNGDVSVGFRMMAHSEPFLQDSYMNMRKFISDGTGTLDEKTREALALATSSAMNCSSCVRAHFKQSVAKGWTEEEAAEILAVTATCTMYNLAYKFPDLAGDSAFESMSPQLRAHTFQKVSLEQKLVELINIVVSNINSCPTCTTGHVKKAKDLGLSNEEIYDAIRISAVMSAFNTFHRTQ